jgi:hypothetical protein
MKTALLTLFKISMNHVTIALLLLCTFALKAQTLQDFSWRSSNTETGAENVTYTFSYTISTASPDMIFYGLTTNQAIDTIGLGQPLDPAKVIVTIDGNPAKINTQTSGNMDEGVLIRLKKPTLAKSGSRIVVKLHGVTNNVSPGTYAWEWIRTALSNGHAIDEAASITKLTLTGEYHDHQLKDFIWNSSSITAGDKNVTYTFAYKIAAAAPDMIFYAEASNRGIDTKALGRPLDTSMVSVTIDGVPAPIDSKNSGNYGSGVFIKLKDKTLAKSGSQVVVRLHGVTNNVRPGNYAWRWVRTGSHQKVADEAISPAHIKITGQPYDNELKNFSWSSSNTQAGAENVTYTFAYNIVTAAPNMIFYALARDDAIFTDAIGDGSDPSKISVTIDGTPAKIGPSGFANYGSGGFIRLRQPSLAKSGSRIVVKLHGVTNGFKPGSYDWDMITTGRPSGHTEDQVTSPAKITLTGEPFDHSLRDLSWHSSNTRAGAKNVTYTFSYTIVTPSPGTIFRALADKKAIDITPLGKQIDANKVVVTIDGKPATINTKRSVNGDDGLYIRLEKPRIIKGGAQVVVKLHGVANSVSPGTYDWRWISTGNYYGSPEDKARSPAKIELTDE